MDLDDIQKPFIWRKKYEELGQKIDDKQIAEEARRRAEENKIEIQKIEERTRKRDLEYQQRFNDSEFLQRQKESEQHEHWELQEDDFVLRQHKHRSKIRIRDGRAKPIDMLAHYIDVFGVKPDEKKNSSAYLQEEEIDLSDTHVELLNPCDWFNGLRQPDLEDLEPDILVYMKADSDDNAQYWRDLLEITQNELSKLQAVKEQSSTKSSSTSDINSAIVTDVMSLFEGKTISELDDMEDEMSDIIQDDNPSVDVSFYKSALSRLRAYRAKMRLTLNHKKNLKRQKDKILNTAKEKPSTSNSTQDKKSSKDKINLVKMEDLSIDASKEETKDETVESKNLIGDDDDDDADSRDKDEQVVDQFEEVRLKCIDDYERGCYSPKSLEKHELDPKIVCVDYNKDYELLVHFRNQICNASNLDEAKIATMTSEERAFMEAAKKGMDTQEESVFSCESAITGTYNRPHTYAWADKYQPRKPRYFNRVNTGFEWNKYNQTHYDIDNPPPKVVQGYKFNIFYPDLIDKSKAPTFTLTPCKDDKDFSTIRFSAGPPYEDIAFRIVNREWNNSHKSGYRCQFINNMLQLWFQFKRYRYRR